MDEQAAPVADIIDDVFVAGLSLSEVPSQRCAAGSAESRRQHVAAGVDWRVESDVRCICLGANAAGVGIAIVAATPRRRAVQRREEVAASKAGYASSLLRTALPEPRRVVS
jgi:hypothetical protein